VSEQFVCGSGAAGQVTENCVGDAAARINSQSKFMAHSHHDHSHEHVRRLSSLNRAFVAGILLNSVFVAAEFTAGILSNSMGLLSDAGHNLSDVASLLLALLAFRLAQVRPTSRYTYG